MGMLTYHVYYKANTKERDYNSNKIEIKVWIFQWDVKGKKIMAFQKFMCWLFCSGGGFHQCTIKWVEWISNSPWRLASIVKETRKKI